ncbi:hypothetical protein CesoFtcFv8_016733 [Champsocephalus esox]|uniref:Uncharacterized protein n=1 Tax=Champsocephalus esox TaxID=159716 RepID=A0AAN8BNT7_9TELE|nr:hypothetical protein CesoFtcFv8_016733 [Champsocephalus esox]
MINQLHYGFPSHEVVSLTTCHDHRKRITLLLVVLLLWSQTNCFACLALSDSLNKSAVNETGRTTLLVSQPNLSVIMAITTCHGFVDQLAVSPGPTNMQISAR